MLKTLGELIRKYPSSPLRLEAEQILGDYFFDKSDLAEAEKHYHGHPGQPALAGARPGPLQDGVDPREPGQARGGGRLLRGRRRQRPHARAWTPRRRSTSSARRCWTWSTATPRPGRPRARSSTSRSSPSRRATFALALDKLGNRYFIKQQYEFAIPALRKLMEIQPDPELDLERGREALRRAQGGQGQGACREPEDMRFLVRAAVQARSDPDAGRGRRARSSSPSWRRWPATWPPSCTWPAQKKDDKAHVHGRRRRPTASTSRSSAPRSTCGRS